MNGVAMNNRKVRLTARGIEVGGRYEVLLCGSLFYFRLPREVWKDRIEKLKATGYNCVDVYFPWNYHERADGSFDFTGERDVRAFLQLLKEAGLFVIARPGPYICSEWDGGALPARILESGMPIRCDDPRYLAEVEKWYSAILPEIEPFTYQNGGTVILLQLENELDFFDCPDPEAYIGKLLAFTRKYCKDVCCFCCAGQFDVTRAGGFTEGVEATLNCYPESLDPSFDKELQGYAFRFEERNKPLLVSETNRDHFLLRRELSCGAKLLGAYNQVAGFNFGYHQAINNWGKPNSVMVTEYDFESMIDAAGGYTREAEEALLFSSFLKTVGESIAAALPEEEHVFPDRCSFVTTEGGLSVLSLMGGGEAVCVPNFSLRGNISFTFRGKHIEAEVAPSAAAFFLFGYPLAGKGIPAVLTRANCEPVYADEKTVVFYAEKCPMAGVDFGDGEILLTENATVHGVDFRFLGREEALSFLSKGNPLRKANYRAKEIGGFCEARLPERRELPVREGAQNFMRYGATEGALCYRVELPERTSLFLEQPCDLLRCDTDGKRGETVYADGRDVILSSMSGKYDIVLEKWGHCNFDDPQSPSLRIASGKGVRSFAAVLKEERIGRCDFSLLDEYGQKKLSLKESFPVRLAVEKWNSTRKPVVCAYTFPLTREEERLILKTTEACDVAVYLGGELLGECDFGTFELTKYLEKGQTGKVTLVYRKHVWTQDVGCIRALHLKTVLPASVSALAEGELIKLGGRGEALSLPIRISAEKALTISVSAEKEGFLKFAGKNVKLTCVMDGRTIGRLFVGWEHAPVLEGGDPARLYLCPKWSGQLYLYAEALGEGAKLTGVELLQPE